MIASSATVSEMLLFHYNPVLTYRLFQPRNQFIHHDLSSPIDVLQDRLFSLFQAGSGLVYLFS
jgi:hypothetical protein